VPPRRNIELKARLASIDAAREIAQSVATEHLGTQTQVDTYFRCESGRLKLRQSNVAPAQLVSYRRPDISEAKASDYRLLDVDEPEQLLAMLHDNLGIECVVEKSREVFLYHNVRIHLDEVAGLGTFLEFEAVLDDSIDDAQGHAQVAKLTTEFQIAETDLVHHSYSDMVERHSRPAR